MNSTQNVLWKNVPDTLKNNELIEQYIETIGEVFDEVRKEINDQRFAGDYAENDINDVILTASDYGIEFPRNLSEDIKRRFVRDANEVFSRLGTRNGLEWAVRTIGVENFNIDEIWAPNPNYLRKGYYKDIGNSQVTRYTIDNSSYNNFYVGREVVKNNGTFFEGYIYSDVKKKNKVTDIPIYGETYLNYTNVDFTDTVSKTPYVAVKIFDNDYGILLDEYTDPETGITYTYTARERKQIIGQMISYFIQGLQRAANTKIIVITDFFYYTEKLDLDMPLIFDVDWNVFPITDTFGSNFSSNSDIVGKFNQADSLIVGDDDPIGFHPYYSISEYVAKKVGIAPFTLEVDESIRFQDYFYYIYPPGNEKTLHTLYMDYYGSVEITNKFGGYVIVIEHTNQAVLASSSWSEIGRISYNETFNKTFPNGHSLRLTYIKGKDIEDEPDEPTPVSITYAI